MSIRHECVKQPHRRPPEVVEYKKKAGICEMGALCGEKIIINETIMIKAGEMVHWVKLLLHN